MVKSLLMEKLLILEIKIGEFDSLNLANLRFQESLPK